MIRSYQEYFIVHNNVIHPMTSTAQ